MKVFSLDEWFEENKNEFFECYVCDGDGEVDDDEFDDSYTCIICDGQGKIKLKDFSNYYKKSLYKKLLYHDVKKYCNAIGLDFETEWEKIKKSQH